MVTGERVKRAVKELSECFSVLILIVPDKTEAETAQRKAQASERGEEKERKEVERTRARSVALKEQKEKMRAEIMEEMRSEAEERRNETAEEQAAKYQLENGARAARLAAIVKDDQAPVAEDSGSNTRDQSTESVVNPKKRTSDKTAFEYGPVTRKLARSGEDGDEEDVDEAVEEEV